MLKSTGIHVNDRSKFIVGFNNCGSSQWEVIEHLPDGKERVLLIGLSKDKSNAVALILNAPEEK